MIVVKYTSTGIQKIEWGENMVKYTKNNYFQNNKKMVQFLTKVN
jgi:hypothetical protein